MGEVKTIKGVDENVWAEFKSMAAEEKKNMGDLLEELVNFYKEKKAKKFWDDILTVKEPLTKYEADKMMKTVTRLRKESGFRDVKWD